MHYRKGQYTCLCTNVFLPRPVGLERHCEVIFGPILRHEGRYDNQAGQRPEPLHQLFLKARAGRSFPLLVTDKETCAHNSLALSQHQGKPQEERKLPEKIRTVPGSHISCSIFSFLQRQQLISFCLCFKNVCTENYI